MSAPEARIPLAYRTLGSTGLRISEIGFGCGASAGLMVSDDSDAQGDAVKRALELGVNYFDTAPVYGNTRSETNLGRALDALHADPVVVTKIALTTNELDDIEAAVVYSVEKSLERMGREKFDVVFLHNRVAEKREIKPNVRVGALLSVDDVLGRKSVVSGLARLRAQGRVRFFGFCGFGGELPAIAEVIDSNHFDAMLTHYNLINQTAWLSSVTGSAIEDYGGIAARAADRGLGIVVLRVLEGGLLAENPREAELPATPERQARLPALDFLRGPDGGLAPAAIRFALTNRAVSTVLIGVGETSHIESAIAAASRGPLAPDLLDHIERVRRADYR